MPESLATEKKEQSGQKPPRSVGRIAGEVLSGTATAAALVYLSLYVVGYGANSAGLGNGCMDGLMILGIMAYAVPPFYVLGCAIGIHFVGSRGNQTGSFMATLGGVFLGLPVMALLYFYMHVAEDMMLGIEKMILWPLIFLAPAIMATLCFNLTRRYRNEPKEDVDRESNNQKE